MMVSEKKHMRFPDLAVVGSYDYRLVALSIVIAVVASYAALDVAGRVTAAHGWVRRLWLTGGALTQGMGIWAMHYVGMLSLRLPLPTRYHWPTALLALFIALFAAFWGLFVVSRRQMGSLRVVAGSILVGSGIVGMHYTAMASMRLAAMCRYSPALVTLSVVFAFALALLSLRLAFAFRGEAGGRLPSRLGSALLMGAAICAMHYTAMAAASFTRSDMPPDWSHAVSVSTLGITGIGIVTVMVLGLAVLTSMLDQREQAKRQLQRSFEELRALAARLQSVREEERTRVAREIHDELGQALTSIKIDLAALLRELPIGQTSQVKRAESILKLSDETIQSVRRIATDLRPGVLDDLGLVAAVEWAAEEFQHRTGVKCHVSLPDADLAIEPESATAVFRILQETLTNIARHANASEVNVQLSQENGTLCLEVRDNGKGIDEEQISSSLSLGLLGIRERALLLGGEVTIHGARGKGTTVKLRIPDVHRASPEPHRD